MLKKLLIGFQFYFLNFCLLAVGTMSNSAYSVDCSSYVYSQTNFFNVKTDFGAVGDGITNDSVALQNAFDQAKIQGKSVYVPAGTYLIGNPLSTDDTSSGSPNPASRLKIDGISVFGEGDQTLFQKVAPAALCKNTTTNQICSYNNIVLVGESPSLRCIKIQLGPNAANGTPLTRFSNSDQTANIRAWEAHKFTIENVTSVGAQSVGIMILGSSGNSATDLSIIKNSNVNSTLADGIHITNSTTLPSAYIDVSNNTIGATADDAIAVVSYRSVATKSHDITIHDNTITSGLANGITVAGGDLISITNNKISNTIVSGLYFAALKPPPYNSLAPSNILAKGNILNNVVTGGSGKGAIYITADSTYTNAADQPGSIQILGNTIETVKEFQLGAHIQRARNIEFSGNRMNNVAGIAVKVDNVVNIDITHNQMTAMGKDSGSHQVYFENTPANSTINVNGNFIETIPSAALESPHYGPVFFLIAGTNYPAGTSFNVANNVFSNSLHTHTNTKSRCRDGSNNLLMPCVRTNLFESNNFNLATPSDTANCSASQPPSAWNYGSSHVNYIVGTPISANVPASSGPGTVYYTISPKLPAGLNFDMLTGAITGTPTSLQPWTSHTVRASNCKGSRTFTLNIAVSSAPNSLLSEIRNSVKVSGEMGQTDKRFCYKKSNGSLYCYGSLMYGQSALTHNNSPYLVFSSGVEDFSSDGVLHECAIVSGALYCWGYNGNGVLGVNSYNSASYIESPTLVTGMESGVTSVIANGYNTCALKRNAQSVNELFCWGYNYYGQTGTGIIRNYVTEPTKVELPDSPIQFFVGQTGCALMPNQSLYCWGYNYYGNVGSGSPLTIIRNPQQVLLGGPAISLSISDYVNCATVGSNRDFKCWGDYYLGYAPVQFQTNVDEFWVDGWNIAFRKGSQIFANYLNYGTLTGQYNAAPVISVPTDSLTSYLTYNHMSFCSVDLTKAKCTSATNGQTLEMYINSSDVILMDSKKKKLLTTPYGMFAPICTNSNQPNSECHFESLLN